MATKPTKPEAAKPNGLIGIILYMSQNKSIHYQGANIGADGDMVLHQMVSWLSCVPTNVVGILRSAVYLDECKPYANIEMILVRPSRHKNNSAGAAWDEIVSTCCPGVLTNADRPAEKLAARLIAESWEIGREFKDTRIRHCQRCSVMRVESCNA